MKKIVMVSTIFVALGVIIYFVYVIFFAVNITVINVAVPNISFKYSNLPTKDISVVFFNKDTGNWYMDRQRSGSGEATTMVSPGMPQGNYSLQVINTQTTKKLAESESFTVGAGAKPIITIDQASLSTSIRNPIISGTAQNIYDISILVEDASLRRYFGGEADVSPENGGVWSIKLTESDLPNGVYTVKVFNSRDGSQGVLASGTLVVSVK